MSLIPSGAFSCIFSCFIPPGSGLPRRHELSTVELLRSPNHDLRGSSATCASHGGTKKRPARMQLRSLDPVRNIASETGMVIYCDSYLRVRSLPSC